MKHIKNIPDVKITTFHNCHSLPRFWWRVKIYKNKIFAFSSFSHTSKFAWYVCYFAKRQILFGHTTLIMNFVYASETLFQRHIFKVLYLAHLSRRLTRWAFRMGLELASVHPSVRPSVRSHFQTWISPRPAGRLQQILSEASLGWGKAALGFDADQIRTLVSMATDSSHRVIMREKGVITFSRLFLIGSFLYLQVTMTYIRACMSSKFGRIRPRTTELAALERRKKFP